MLAGRARQRIRVVDHPRSDYVRYQLVGYIESAAVGEEIRVAVRDGGAADARRELAEVRRDFWLFDPGALTERVVLLDYDDAGQLTCCRLASATEAASCSTAWSLATRHAIPLNEYLALAGLGTANA